jgi:hypothetical protein
LKDGCGSEVTLAARLASRVPCSGKSLKDGVCASTGAAARLNSEAIRMRFMVNLL